MQGMAKPDELLAPDPHHHDEGPARRAAHQGSHQRLVLLRVGDPAAVQLRLRTQSGDDHRGFRGPAVDRIRFRRRPDPQPQLCARAPQRLPGRPDRRPASRVRAVPRQGAVEPGAADGGGAGLFPCIWNFLQCERDSSVLDLAACGGARHLGIHGHRHHVQRPHGEYPAA